MDPLEKDERTGAMRDRNTTWTDNALGEGGRGPRPFAEAVAEALFAWNIELAEVATPAGPGPPRPGLPGRTRAVIGRVTGRDHGAS